jgi:biopolymer transport protein ExbD/biopolymer transport protein TolR
VLLIIFMVVTPLLEKELSVALPAERRSVRASDVSASQLAVHVDDSGGLAINQNAVGRDGYVERLRALLEPRAAEQRVVFVTASDGARYPQLVEAMDGAKQAGAVTVGLAIEGSP